MQNLRALALDPNDGLLFWSDWFDKNPRIECATMAGTQRKTLFQIKEVVGGGWPNGLTCDYMVKRLYWIDAKSDSVHTIRYDGGDERQILKSSIYLAHPFAITVFEDFFYFSDWRSKNLYKASHSSFNISLSL
jgi:integrin beta 2